MLSAKLENRSTDSVYFKLILVYPLCIPMCMYVIHMIKHVTVFRHYPDKEI